MKTLNIVFSDSDYKLLNAKKNILGLTWRAVIINGILKLNLRKVKK